jgi:hypothetical protein
MRFSRLCNDDYAALRARRKRRGLRRRHVAATGLSSALVQLALRLGGHSAMNLRALLACALAALLLGCAGPGPILYPNPHAQTVGKGQAEADIAQCRQVAEAAGASGDQDAAERAAKGTATGGLIGAAGGAVGGAISGGAGTGALIGAASGATIGLLQSLFAGPQVSPAYRNIVDRCLRERGYEPAGWE